MLLLKESGSTSPNSNQSSQELPIVRQSTQGGVAEADETATSSTLFDEDFLWHVKASYSLISPLLPTQPFAVYGMLRLEESGSHSHVPNKSRVKSLQSFGNLREEVSLSRCE